MTYLGVNGKSIALLGWWVPALAIAVGSGIGENRAIAQLIPDDTLGSESSIVTPLDGLVDRIDGGAIRGSNLFHSFQEFNIDTGRGAFFDNPAAIENILTRVTGGNPSEIFGTLGVLGDANLFLVNPNGIVFGPEAQLDVGGSFFASTAGGILFPDGYEFSATNPDAPPLLTVNVPIGLQFGANPGGIINQSVATNDAGEVRGLSVPSGETLALVGGNVTLDGGSVQPRGGRVELGGLAGVGAVEVNADSTLSFPEGVERADVSLSNEAEVNVRAGGGGEISIHARNVQMSGDSTLRAGIEREMGAPDAQAGDINIEATGTVALSEGSFISNVVRRMATGNSGDVHVTSQTLSLTGNAESFPIFNGTSISSSSFGMGNGGSVKLQVRDTITLDTTAIFSQIEDSAIGNPGDIEITAGSLFLTNGTQVLAGTRGRGNAGNIRIRAADTVSLDGFATNPEGRVFFSGITSSVVQGATGNGGNVEITANSVLLSNGSFLGSRILGQGDGGRISIQAETVTFDSGSVIQNQVFPTGVGNSGGIEIVTGSLFLNNGSSLATTVTGQGNAGPIEIRAADTVVLDAIDVDPFDAAAQANRSAIGTVIGPNTVGNSQGIKISTESLILRNSVLSASSLGRGNAGPISIQATEIVSDNSLISSTIEPGGIGNSQGIEISTGSLSISNSPSGIVTYTAGEGNAGDVSIQATGSVFLDNSALISSVNSSGIGQGGNFSITARNLYLDDTGILTTTLGQGDAGNILVRVTDSVTGRGLPGLFAAVSDRGTGFAEGMGRGGDIDIETGDLFLGDGASLFASTDGRGDAGRVRIRARDSVTLDDGFIFTSASVDAVGNAQGIEIITDRLSLSNASINASTNGRGDAGRVNIQASDVSLNNSRISSSALSEAVGNAEGIEITTDRLSLSNASIDASTNGRGDAGRVKIQASDTVTLDDSRISSSGLSGAVGNAEGIEINTDRLFLNDSDLDSFRDGEGSAGEIEVNANRIRLDEGFINTATRGGEGNINLNSQELILENNSQIGTRAFGNRRGGNITINSDVIAALNNSDITANALEGRGGDVSITAQGIFGTEFRQGVANTPQSDITATGASRLQDGSVQLNVEVDPTSGLVSLPETPVDAASLLGTDFCSQRRESEFIYTGRGGIPPQPSDPASPTTVWQDWSLTEIPETPTAAATPMETRLEGDRLVEAQGWYVNERGQVVLTANPVTTTPHQSGRVPIECRSLLPDLEP